MSADGIHLIIVEAYVRERIHSVEQLDVLLLLRAYELKTWSSEEIGVALRSHKDSIEQRLHALCDDGGVERVASASAAAEFRYRFAPPSPGFRALIDELADLYQARKYTVIGWIYSGTERPQKDSLRAFVDAFRVRGERNEDG